MAKRKTDEGTKLDKAVHADKSDALAAIKGALAKSGASMLLDIAPDAKTPRISTGVLSIDEALSGGIMRGKISEFFGEEASGKSLISLLTIAEAQRQGKICMYIDVEYGFDPEWAKKLGVDISPDKLIIPDIAIDKKDDAPVSILTAEKIFQIICDVALTRQIGLIVVDSIAAMITEDEFEKELTEDRYASLAKKLKEGLGKAVPILAKTGTTLILINQVRDDIGSYVKSVHTPGGRALKHLISTRVMFKKAGSQDQLKTGDDVKGVDISCKTIKHRGGANFRGASFRIWYDTGFDKEYDLFTYLLAKGDVVQNGSIYSFQDIKYQGEAKFVNALKADQAFHDKALAVAKSYIENANKEAIGESEVPTYPVKEED